MAITVLFFGQLVEITGSGEFHIDETGEIRELVEMNGNNEITSVTGIGTITGTKELKKLLFSHFPRLADMIFNIAVNSVIIEEDTNLDPGSTVAFLPPFSGG